ncbi:substrate-binding domain-containing protein [Pantoea vagans]|uniref:substrate-binding domain-containing protein n=1 Tax=Pantoea vagans TaxID=470934 RepID=UPI0030172C88
MAADQIVVDYLSSLSETALEGQKVPTVRHLMKQFGLSQLVVQRALTLLKEGGKIRAEIGRGTFFCGQESPDIRPSRDAINVYSSRNILLLRRSVSAGYGRAVLQKLEDLLTTSGAKVLEVSYNDAEHARLAMQGLPTFDTCIIQSSFEMIGIETLNAIREKASSIILHGLGLTGTEVDCIGLDWGTSVSKALRILFAQGHRRIGFVTTDLPFMSNLMGTRRFIDWCDDHKCNVDDCLIQLPLAISGEFETAVVAALKNKRSKAGKFPFTALICWGVEHHARLLKAFIDLNIRVPDDLSVILLGGPDDARQQSSVFTTLGSTSESQAEGLYGLIGERLAEPESASKVSFLPVDLYESKSIMRR